jgi:hypothetical protein
VEAVGKGCVSCGRGGGSGETGARQSGGNRGLNTVSTGGRRCSDRAADEWAPTVSDFIQNWLKFKNQNGCFDILQKFPFFHVARMGYDEKISQLC